MNQFKEMLDHSKSTYEKKAVKAIYDGHDKDLNLFKFYLDKIKDLREQGINFSEAEIQPYAQRLKSSLLNYINEQKQEDIRSISGNSALYKNVLYCLRGEDLNKPDIKSLLDSIRLPETIKDNIQRSWLNDLEIDDNSTIVSQCLANDIQISENNDSEGVTTLGSDNDSVEEVYNDFG
jgi:hypothetical protein